MGDLGCRLARIFEFAGLKGEMQEDHTEVDLLLTSANPSVCHVQTPSARDPYNNDSYMMAETIFEAFMQIFWLRVEPTQLQIPRALQHQVLAPSRSDQVDIQQMKPDGEEQVDIQQTKLAQPTTTTLGPRIDICVQTQGGRERVRE